MVRGTLCGFAAILIAWAVLAQNPRVDENALWRHRNLGKAFYENPTTQAEAVGEFRKALDLAPRSPREQVNYGLSLLRAGKVPEGIAELRKAQQADPKIPHTWFNLGVALKRNGDLDGALPQLREMARLVPTDPITHYQIGAILKAQGEIEAAVREFETARDLNPKLAAPHFQLYGIRRDPAELSIFQQIKKEQEGAPIPEDMEWNAYSEIYDAPPPAPSQTPATPVFRSETVATGWAGGHVTAIRLSATDRPAVIAWSPAHTALFREGRTLVADSGLESLKDVVFIAPGDFDNDGLTDLCVVTKTGAALYRNVAGKFRKSADIASGAFRHALWLDYDHDYDPDLFLFGDESKLLRNNGSAGFSDESARFPFVTAPAIYGARAEMEPDVPGFDLLVTYRDRPAVRYRDLLSGSYKADASPTNLADLSPFATADFDGSGKLGRAHISAEGALILEHNVTPNAGNWIEIALIGVKNMKTAVGSKVEVKAGARYGRQTYDGIPLVFPLGAETQVDTVRITWPNGLIQNEIKPVINRIAQIKEAPRLSGSCPMIFTWDGGKFRFITDVLGVAPLGASSGDGHYFPVDHDEYVSIPGESLVPRNGALEIRVTEELREVSYIDQLHLQALDHPADIAIVTNEKFKAPPFPEFRLFGVRRRIDPITARDHNGADVRAALRARDAVYPDAFRRDAAGVAELHHLDLDFGSAAASNRAVLIMQGWVDWADGSTFLSAMQEHKDLTFPYLQVKDANGQWKTVTEDMGIPSGKPKPMAVDLTGKFLSASRQVRIVTNLSVYWDEIFMVEDSDAPPARLTSIPAAAADLQFRGFSRAAIHPERKQPESFDYQSVSSVSMWNPTPGNYTRFGDVRELVDQADDRMVVMGSGDEIRLRFDASGLPPLPAGWKRDYLLLVDGWAKDADANTAFSQSVLPLPFHKMSSYPYPAGEHFPDDPAHREYQSRFNTRPALRLIRPLHHVTTP